jgi:hypothetical protein
MKMRIRNFTLKHYIRFMRRQNKHIQHVHAIAFAGIITALISGVLLYTEYGFWHETYVAEDALVVVDPNAPVVSPSESFKRFFEQARDNFRNMGTSTSGLLEGKETFSR